MEQEVVSNQAEATPAVQTTPNFDELLKNPEFNKSLSSYVDKKNTEAITTYKERGFANAVDKEVENRLKAKENKTPEQIRLEETEFKLNQVLNTLSEKEKTEMRLRNKDTARSLTTEANIPDDILDFLIDEDSEKTKTNVEKVLKIFDNYKTKITQTTINNNNIRVPSKTANKTVNEPGPNASKEEWKAFLKQKN